MSNAMNSKHAEHCINQIIIEEDNICQFKAAMDSARSDHDRDRIRKKLETSIARRATWELLSKDDE
jgi:hypothetical protein